MVIDLISYLIADDRDAVRKIAVQRIGQFREPLERYDVFMHRAGSATRFADRLHAPVIAHNRMSVCQSIHVAGHEEGQPHQSTAPRECGHANGQIFRQSRQSNEKRVR